MTLVDWLIIGIILLFSITGYMRGFVATVVSWVGTILAIFISLHFFKPLGDWLSNIFGWSGGAVHFLVFALAFILLFIGVELLFKLINRALRIITELPVISFANRILGLLFGVIQGVLVAVILLFVISKFPVSAYLTSSVDNSILAPKLQVVIVLAQPMIPGAIQTIQSATTLFQ
jgi:membrane protein required for colicin V production